MRNKITLLCAGIFCRNSSGIKIKEEEKQEEFKEVISTVWDTGYWFLGCSLIYNVWHICEDHTFSSEEQKNLELEPLYADCTKEDLTENGRQNCEDENIFK